MNQIYLSYYCGSCGVPEDDQPLPLNAIDEPCCPTCGFPLEVEEVAPDTRTIDQRVRDWVRDWTGLKSCDCDNYRNAGIKCALCQGLAIVRDAIEEARYDNAF